MTREEIRNEIVQITNNNILLELPTSMGKTKCALDLLELRNKDGPILIVIPRLVLIDNWKKEFEKWNLERLLQYTQFVTYHSLEKMCNKQFSVVIYDECHHLSDRCCTFLPAIQTQTNILLSATVPQKKLQSFQHIFKDLYVYSKSLKEALEDNILPDPTIYLLPLVLDNKHQIFEFVKNKSTKAHIITIPYEQRWNFINNPKYANWQIILMCTQQQFYSENDKLIQWYRKKLYNSVFRNKFQQACLTRLKWLSEQKEQVVLEILKRLKSYRTLTFCSSINQTIKLGENCINSKNKQSLQLLQDFQDYKINHITACGMLNEGVNLKDCQIGVFASLHSSEIIIAQRNGRLLRHKNPIFIIPYYKNTRDEEIVNKMLEDYNSDKIIKLTNIEHLNTCLNV